MLIVTMNQYLRLGLEALRGQPMVNNYPEPVIFIPEHVDEIYVYLRSKEQNDSLMLFLSVLSSWKIVKNIKKEKAGDFMYMSPGVFVHKKKGLSPREGDILKALLEGASNKIVAEKFRISEKTVCVHKDNALRKLQVKNFHRLYLTYRYWQRCLGL